jgi:hypothetical protein
VPDNRRFFLIDERAHLVNGKRLGILSSVIADYDLDENRLELRFPDGTTVAGGVSEGQTVEAKFFSTGHQGRLIEGPFSDALSAYTGWALRLVHADPRLSAVDRGPAGAVSLISDASVERLSSLADESVDPRRFRMLIEASGLGSHEEDSFVGRRVRIGEALVAFEGHVGRCLVTNRDPDTGEVTLPTLRLLSYRKGLETTEPLAFGVYGAVLEPGIVRLGDAIRVER